MANLELLFDLKKFNEYLKGENYLNTINKIQVEIEKDFTNTYVSFEDNIPMGNYFTLLVLAKPFHDFGAEFTEEFLVNPSDIEGYDEYLDKVIKYFVTGGTDVRALCRSIAFIIDELSIFSTQNALLQSGPNISLYDLYAIGKRDKNFNGYLDFSTEDMNGEDNFQSIIEEHQDVNTENILNSILEDEGNSYKTLIKSKSGININQLNEVAGWIGYKPDLFGNVIPEPIDTSFIRGLRNPTDFLIDAIAARKALITTKSEVRKSGYLTRRISILTGDIKLSGESEDCGSKHYLYKYIKDKKTLSFYFDRYYVDEGTDEEVLITEGNNEDLIGKTIRLRSPLTCAMDNEDVCQKCYGHALARVNKGLGIGTIATLLLTNPMTQKLLSTKHLQRVVIKDFNWSEEFEKRMRIEGYTIKPVDDKSSIVIDVDNLIEEAELDYNRYSVKKFSIKDSKTGELVNIVSPVTLTVPDSNIDDIDNFLDSENDVYEFNIKDIKEDHLFAIHVKNTGIADPLLEIKGMLEKKEYITEVIDKTNYHKLMDRFIELLIDSGTFIRSVHMEVILRNMIFIDGGYKQRVNFVDPEFRPDIEIKNVNQSIYENPSPVKSLMFEHVNKQITTDSFNDLFNKNDKSIFDKLFDIMD